MGMLFIFSAKAFVPCLCITVTYFSGIIYCHVVLSSVCYEYFAEKMNICLETNLHPCIYVFREPLHQMHRLTKAINRYIDTLCIYTRIHCVHTLLIHNVHTLNTQCIYTWIYSVYTLKHTVYIWIHCVHTLEYNEYIHSYYTMYIYIKYTVYIHSNTQCICTQIHSVFNIHR